MKTKLKKNISYRNSCSRHKRTFVFYQPNRLEMKSASDKVMEDMFKLSGSDPVNEFSFADQKGFLLKAEGSELIRCKFKPVYLCLQQPRLFEIHYGDSVLNVLRSFKIRVWLETTRWRLKRNQGLWQTTGARILKA